MLTQLHHLIQSSHQSCEMGPLVMPTSQLSNQALEGRELAKVLQRLLGGFWTQSQAVLPESILCSVAVPGTSKCMVRGSDYNCGVSNLYPRESARQAAVPEILKGKTVTFQRQWGSSTGTNGGKVSFQYSFTSLSGQREL